MAEAVEAAAADVGVVEVVEVVRETVKVVKGVEEPKTANGEVKEVVKVVGVAVKVAAAASPMGEVKVKQAKVGEVEQEEVDGAEAHDTQITHHHNRARSIGSMGKILGIVPRLRLVLGLTSRCPSLQETIETSASLIF